MRARVEWLLRAAAAGIALGGVLAPSCDVETPARVRVAVVGADAGVARVRHALGEAGARVESRCSRDLTDLVVVGGLWPEDCAPADGVRIHHVRPRVPDGGVWVSRIEGPSRVRRGHPFSVRVHVSRTRAVVQAATGRTHAWAFELQDDGVPLARGDARWMEDSPVAIVDVPVVAMEAGERRWRIAPAGGGLTPAASESAEWPTWPVTVDDGRWRVLAWDVRPSWMARFVRDALAEAPAFDVASVTSASRGVLVTRGAAPRAPLPLPAELGEADAVVVGGPEALTPAAVNRLDEYMRVRGGVVVLLADEPAGERVRTSWLPMLGADVRRFEEALDGRTPGHDSTVPWLRARRVLPLRERLGVDIELAARDANGTWPLVASRQVGAGRLIVVLGVDAWQHRDRSQSAFDQYWPLVLGRHLIPRLAPVRVAPAYQWAPAGAPVRWLVTLRPDLAARYPSWSAHIEASGAAASVLAWPIGGDQWALEGRAPAGPGLHRLIVQPDATADEETGLAHLRVGVTLPVDDASVALAAAWTARSGGTAVSADDVGALLDAVTARGRRERRAVRPWSHPLAALVFAVSAGGEWWLRRRRGAA